MHGSTQGDFVTRRSRLQALFLAPLFALGVFAGAAAQVTAPNATSPLATNLEWVTDYMEAWVFVDAFRGARAWTSGTPTEFADKRTVSVDSQGWVSSLLPGQVARATMLLSQKPLPAGDYVVLYEGEGTLEYGGATTYDAAKSTPGRHVLQLNPAKSGLMLTIAATSSGNPIRNIRVIMPGGTCSNDPFRYATGAAGCLNAGYYQSFESSYRNSMFHPVFLASLRKYRALRFMDWGRTNGSTQERWDQRPKPTDATWFSAKGVPVEVMVELANRVGADAWFTIPHLADDNYVTQFAAVVKQKLRGDRKAYVEYSNEVWNTLFAQTEYAQKQGLALALSPSAGQAGLYFYSKRAVEIFEIWRTQLGGPKRLVRVMATQAANPWTAAQVLDFQDAKAKTDVFAVGPYFGGRLGSPGEKSRVMTMTADALLDELENKALPLAISAIVQSAAAAKARNLPLISYEGGQHLAGFGGVESDDKINDLFDRVNRHQRMGTIYRKYLDAWKANGGQMFTHYLHTGAYNHWGRWGSLEYQDQPRADAPKFDALQKFIEEVPQWW
jgi:hypothetical protein